MLSPRGGARLGLAAAVLMFVGTVSVIAMGSVDARKATIGQPGTYAPTFALTDTAGKRVSLAQQHGSIVVLCFTSVRCPLSNDYAPRLADLARRYGGTGSPPIRFLAVESVAREDAPGAGPAVAVQAKLLGLSFPQLLDVGNSVAHRYGVESTPTFLVLDPAGLVCYRGPLDDSRDPRVVHAHYLDDAIQSTLAGKPAPRAAVDVPGCPIR